MTGEGNGWSEYEKLVLAELERHSQVIEGLAREVRAMSVDVALFKRAVEAAEEHRLETELQMTDLRNRVKRLDEWKAEMEARDQERVNAKTETSSNRKWTITVAIMAAGYVILPIVFFAFGGGGGNH